MWASCYTAKARPVISVCLHGSVAEWLGYHGEVVDQWQFYCTR